MKRRFTVSLMLVVLGVAVLLVAASAQEASRNTFALGGSFAGVLSTPDGGWPELLEMIGVPALPNLWILSGGLGRIGAVGGWSIGGVGWELSAAMSSGDGLAAAEFVAGFGGLDVGAVLAGSRRSFLTAGTVVGGGAGRVTLALGGESAETVPNGIVVGTEFSSACAFLSAAPYVSMQVQPLRFLGFELRFGYLFELASIHWHDEPTPLGLPELRFEGLWATLGVSWGWASLGRRTFGAEAVERVQSISVPITGEALHIENAIGNVVLRHDAGPEYQQTGSQRVVRGSATVRAPADIAGTITSEVRVDEGRVVVTSETPERAGGWRIDYDLIVPPGTPLELDVGVGDVRIEDAAGSCEARTGVGDIEIGNASGESLTVSVGVGSLTIGELRSPEASLAVETGSVDLRLAKDANANLVASVGLGNIEICGFAQSSTTARGTLGRDIEGTLGSGAAEQQVTVRVGVGEIRIGASGDGAIGPNEPTNESR